jgi:hypothetical protein
LSFWGGRNVTRNKALEWPDYARVRQEFEGGHKRSHIQHEALQLELIEGFLLATSSPEVAP